MRIRHLMIGVAAAAVAVWSLTTAAPAADPIKVGYIGSFDTDTGKSTIRGTEIAIEELNANGGVLGGRMIELVMADTREDVQEGEDDELPRGRRVAGGEAVGPGRDQERRPHPHPPPHLRHSHA